MHDRSATLRIVDANANRAAEGLRVVEEYLRFALNDRHLSERCKQLRHELTAALAIVPEHQRLAARDTPGDVGTQIGTAQEYTRGSPHAVWQANQKRVEQSLRCLEEYGKILSPDLAASFEAIRYQVYSLAKAIDCTQRNRTRLMQTRLYGLIDGADSLEDFTVRARKLVQAGLHVLQLRDKRLSDRELLSRARRLREVTRETPTLFVMNDRVDLAVLAQADGVHLGQDEMAVADARSLIGPDALIGVSTHSLDQARQAVLDGADYLGCGPTFPSRTKSFEQFPGLEFLRRVAEEITLPAFAIGGISLDNLPSVLQAGFSRVAISGALSPAEDVAAVVGKFLALLPAEDRGETRANGEPGH